LSGVAQTEVHTSDPRGACDTRLSAAGGRAGRPAAHARLAIGDRERRIDESSASGRRPPRQRATSPPSEATADTVVVRFAGTRLRSPLVAFVAAAVRPNRGKIAPLASCSDRQWRRRGGARRQEEAWDCWIS
jgi:hypothetical protein